MTITHKDDTVVIATTDMVDISLDDDDIEAAANAPPQYTMAAAYGDKALPKRRYGRTACIGCLCLLIPLAILLILLFTVILPARRNARVDDDGLGWIMKLNDNGAPNAFSFSDLTIIGSSDLANTASTVDGDSLGEPYLFNLAANDNGRLLKKQSGQEAVWSEQQLGVAGRLNTWTVREQRETYLN